MYFFQNNISCSPQRAVPSLLKYRLQLVYNSIYMNFACSKITPRLISSSSSQAKNTNSNTKNCVHRRTIQISIAVTRKTKSSKSRRSSPAPLICFSLPSSVGNSNCFSVKSIRGKRGYRRKSFFFLHDEVREKQFNGDDDGRQLFEFGVGVTFFVMEKMCFPNKGNVSLR